MDKKRTLIGMVLAMGFVFAWYTLTQYVNNKWGEKLNPTQQTGTSTTQPTPASVASATTGSTGAGGATSQATAAGLQVLETSASKAPAALGSDTFEDPQYAMQLRTTPTGAGIEAVVLNNYLKSVKDPKKERYTFQEAPPAVIQQYGHPLATRSITVEGQTVDLSKTIWTLEKQDTESATYAVTLGTRGDPVVKVRKTYRIFQRKSTEHRGLGYEIRLEYGFDNLSGRRLPISLSFNGPSLPPRELDSGPDQRSVAGYHEAGGIIVENHYVESFYKDESTREMAVNEKKVPMWWGGGGSVYFEAIVMPPLLPDGKTASIRSFKAIGLDPHSAHLEKQPVAIVFETADMSLEANETLSYPISVYFGPRHRDVLTTPYYSDLPRQYDHALVIKAGPCSFCAFDWLINVLVAMLGVFHLIARDWGLAIICLVIVVRLCLHPITKRSQVSMMKMGKMGPEMKRLQEKYKDNKEELQKAMWEFQKQQGFTPVLGCLPMFLQMPIWIALWSALNTTFELRHSKFLWGLTWIDDLAKPDRLVSFGAYGFRIPLIGTIVDGFNVLPLLLAVVFYLQMKYQPKPPAATKEQEQQQKIMQVMMVFLFPLFLYSQPSGLNLYILTSTAIGIWESKRIRKHIKEKEEAEKAGLLIVDAEPGSSKKQKDSSGKGPPGAKKQGAGPGNWFTRKLAELQEKAEQARRQNDRRGRDRA